MGYQSYSIEILVITAHFPLSPSADSFSATPSPAHPPLRFSQPHTRLWYLHTSFQKKSNYPCLFFRPFPNSIIFFETSTASASPLSLRSVQETNLYRFRDWTTFSSPSPPRTITTGFRCGGRSCEPCWFITLVQGFLFWLSLYFFGSFTSRSPSCLLSARCRLLSFALRVSPECPSPRVRLTGYRLVGRSNSRNGEAEH